MSEVVEALMVLRRQIDLVNAELRVARRKLEKTAEGSEEARALEQRKAIFEGQARELAEGVKRLEAGR